ncbi:MAG: RNA polymerase sigma factor [Bifidobacteriaceae bacterium]|nr:RNA polymerase sigma factor [Bifidobacteriaceae bacterium]
MTKGPQRALAPRLAADETPASPPTWQATAPAPAPRGAATAAPVGSGSAAKDNAFANLFRANHPRVLAYIRRRVADSETASDIAADVFRLAWERALADAVPGPPWLFVTARNLVANAWRSAERAARLHREVAGHVARDVFPAAASLSGDSSDLRERVDAALQALPGPQREALLAHYWDGLSAKECAALLGCSSTAARMRLSRARAAFSSHYQQLEEKS